MSETTIARVISRALKSLAPPPRIPLSDWLESNLWLPSDVSAVPGPIRLSTPQRLIAEAIGDPEIERVSIVKPVRVGFSTLLTGTLASYVANEPSPILLLLPTESDCRDYAVSDLEPTFSASPALANLLSTERDATGRNTILSRRFPGGSLKIVAAKSPRNLRRHNVRVLLIDEADAMEVTAEGSPITLAEKRTLSFADRKLVIGSTPTLEETSNVLRSYRASDQRIFEIPCPHCGDFFQLRWKNIHWEPDQPETAHAVCPHCGCVIEESQKADMVDAGRFRATAPHVKGHAGFHVNALVSHLANATWPKLAAEFLEAKKSPDTLQTFVNTILAEGWREAADEIQESALTSHIGPFSLDAIPEEVLFITAGVDVQRDRVEVLYVGHGVDPTLWILGQAVAWGSPHDQDTWQDVEDLLRQQWAHPFGGSIGVEAAGIDAGDGETMEAVLGFCKPRFGRKVVAIKGAAGNRPIIHRSQTKGCPLFIVGVDGAKAQIQAKTQAGLIRFSATLEPRFYDEFTSERRVTRYVRGAPVKVWERIPGRRAEGLDCAVYALAVRGLIVMDMNRRADQLRQIPTKPAFPNVIKSAWLSS